MFGNRVVQAFQAEGREDLLQDRVLEQARVDLNRPKRLSSEGVAAAVIVCSPSQQKVYKARGKPFHKSTGVQNKVVTWEEIKDVSGVAAYGSLPALVPHNAPKLCRRRGTSIKDQTRRRGPGFLSKGAHLGADRLVERQVVSSASEENYVLGALEESTMGVPKIVAPMQELEAPFVISGYGRCGILATG
ncbi:hypothetical protein NDU88_002807 [Pleurodeles waltl]|uniref:Uncharacterized protein n=1 Tax=Pleurodeles waltl TaxID=8319 RepID=A0AAV7T4B6_PLEWA|nr:hypothetical protein NDU88_002807 [Pleurodeles waltl]